MLLKHAYMKWLLSPGKQSIFMIDGQPIDNFTNLLNNFYMICTIITSKLYIHIIMGELLGFEKVSVR